MQPLEKNALPVFHCSMPENHKIRTFKEGETVPQSLTDPTCLIKSQVTVVSAIWGDHLDGTFRDVTDIVVEKLSHNRAWEVNILTMHGDACPEAPANKKTLEITFLEEPGAVLETDDTRTFKQGATIHFSGTVVSATFGDHATNQVQDVTNIVQTKLNEGGEWELSNAAMGGNPCPGQEDGITLKVTMRKT
jgi:hypothetical protein